MKIWTKTEEHREGKFLLVRRDGTVPPWSHFALGARDPAAPQALLAYALAAENSGFGKEYADSVRELSLDFEQERHLRGTGDPPAPPHRTDLPLAIAMMRHELDLADVVKTLERIEGLLEENVSGAACLVRLLIDGKRPPFLDRASPPARRGEGAGS